MNIRGLCLSKNNGWGLKLKTRASKNPYILGRVSHIGRHSPAGFTRSWQGALLSPGKYPFIAHIKRLGRKRVAENLDWGGGGGLWNVGCLTGALFPFLNPSGEWGSPRALLVKTSEHLQEGVTGISYPRMDISLANRLNTLPLCHHERDDKVGGRGIAGALCTPTC